MATVETAKESETANSPQNKKTFLFSVQTAPVLISVMQHKNKQANKQQELFFALMSCEKICVMYILKRMCRGMGALTRMLLFLDCIKKVITYFLYQGQKHVQV